MQFLALLVKLIYAYYGLDPFPEYNFFLWLNIDDNGKDIQKLSNDIFSWAKLKVEGNFKVKYDFATSKGRSKSVRPLFRVILTGKFLSAIIVMIQGQKVNFKFK